MILVCSRAEQSLQFEMPDGRKIIIVGKNRAQTDGLILPVGRTKITEDDWNTLSTKYKDVYQIKKGLIFAEKTQEKTLAKAMDVDAEVHHIKTGTEKLTEKDLPAGVKVKKDPNANV